VNVGVWVQALRTVPRTSDAEWKRLDLVSRWLIASRGAVFVLTFISVSIAGLLAIRDGVFDGGLWALTLVALVAAHATNNLLNDFTDFSRGVDHNNYFRALYGPQTLERGLLSKRGLLGYAAASGGVALAIGVYLVWLRGPLALGLLLAGAFFVLFYTFPLKYYGLGELAVLLVWGPLMIGGTYFIVGGAWSWTVALAGIPYALGTTTVIFGKHIDKEQEDRALGIHTLPVIVGEYPARLVVSGLLLAQYALVIYLVAVGFFGPAVLLIVLAVPRLVAALRVLDRPRPKERPEAYPQQVWPLWFVRRCFEHNRRWGTLFLVGLVLDVAIRGFAR
jgi:1,4-dihydroxy-2-naphthoate octaprenyltransferase